MKRTFLTTPKLAILFTMMGCCIAIPASAGDTMMESVDDSTSFRNNEKELPLRVLKGTGDYIVVGFPNTKAPIRIPEVTLAGHNLHFITPCEGLTLQLVQDEEVCYDVIITSDYVELPADITGVFELQILRGAYVFYAEVEL